MTSTTVSHAIRCDAAAQEGSPSKKAKIDSTASAVDELAGVPRPLLPTSHVSADPLVNSLDMPEKTGALRRFEVQTMGGASFSVSLAGQSTVGDLLEKASKEQGLGFCFSLLKMDGELLDDPSLPLPIEDKLQCIIENPRKLCKAAAKLLKARQYTVAKVSEDSICHPSVGICRRLGSFPVSAWPNLSNGATSDTDINEESMEDMTYKVYELTLVDGARKHLRFIGVISDGSADMNTGMFGSIYLRPSLEEVGRIHSHDDSSSWSFKRVVNGKTKWRWSSKKSSNPQWYTAPARPIEWDTVKEKLGAYAHLALWGASGHTLDDHCALAIGVTTNTDIEVVKPSGQETMKFEPDGGEDESNDEHVEEDEDDEEEDLDDRQEEQEEEELEEQDEEQEEEELEEQEEEQEGQEEEELEEQQEDAQEPSL